MKKHLVKLAYIPVIGIANHILDNYIFDKVEPIRGSVLYVDLFCSYIEHSGIYIGDNRIVHLTREGVIEQTTPKAFMTRTTGLRIYVSSNGKASVGSEIVAERAEERIGDKIDYSAVTNNCHKFTSGCLTGKFDNSNVLLSLLKLNAYQSLGAKNWRVWDGIKR